MLFEILHAEWFHIPAVEIATLAGEVAQKQYTNEKTSLRKLLNDKANKPPKDLFSQSLHPRLAAAGRILEKLISAVSNATLQSLFETIFRETGLLKFAMESPDKRKILETLTSFFDFIKEETRRQPALSLQNLVTHLDLMEKEEIELPLVEVNGSADAVNLLTVHGSKGLEFTYIFFAGCNSHNWETKRKPSVTFHFPDTMFGSVSNENEELRRLFYVALTRAETHLYISYSRFRNNGKDAEPSVFIEEIRTGFDMPVEKMVLTTQVVTEFQFLLLQGEQPPEMERIEMDFINRVLEKFQMNVTALNNYLKCPLEFYFKNLIRIPSPKNENTEFGSAVHYALEQLFRYMQDHNNTFPDPGFFVGAFDSYMYRHRESFTKEQFARRMEYGHIVLPAYYEKYILLWNKIVSIERTISNVAIAGVPVRGKLDKLEFDGKQVNVVDYKTGNVENAIPKIKGPSEKLPNGGDYWRQAVFYKLLVDRGQRDWQVISTEFDFIEPNSKKAYIKQKLFITPEDEAIVTGQITDVWAKSRTTIFIPGAAGKTVTGAISLRPISSTSLPNLLKRKNISLYKIINPFKFHFLRVSLQTKYMKRLNFFLLICIAFAHFRLLTGCANIVPPSGGPRDSLPPILVKALPDEYSLHMTSKSIVLTFDEYVDLKDLRKNLIVSPVPKVMPTVRSHLKTVTIELKDTLIPNTTYYLDFGRALVDVNEGNVYKNFFYIFFYRQLY